MYLAEVIVLNDRPVIRIRTVTPRGTFLVGYFGSVDAINDHGRPIELADLQIEGGWLTGVGSALSCLRAGFSHG
jgi:hypothetical protein